MKKIIVLPITLLWIMVCMSAAFSESPLGFRKKRPAYHEFGSTGQIIPAGCAMPV
jgi:hypothetical protein